MSNPSVKFIKIGQLLFFFNFSLRKSTDSKIKPALTLLFGEYNNYAIYTQNYRQELVSFAVNGLTVASGGWLGGER